MNEQSHCRENKKHSPMWLPSGTKADTVLVKSPGPFPCLLLTIILLYIFVSCLVHCWLFFYSPYLILALVHGPGLLKLSEFTVFHRSGDKPWKETWEAFSNRFDFSFHGCRGYRFELLAPLGRGEGTKIENSHHWPMIQSIYLFSETSIQIHECRHSGSFSSGNIRQWFEGSVFSREWRLPTSPLSLCLAHLTHFAVPRFILYNNVRFAFEWSSWVWSSDLLSYWTWSGIMKLLCFVYFIKSLPLRCHLNWGQLWALNMQNLC